MCAMMVMAVMCALRPECAKPASQQENRRTELGLLRRSWAFWPISVPLDRQNIRRAKPPISAHPNPCGMQTTTFLLGPYKSSQEDFVFSIVDCLTCAIHPPSFSPSLPIGFWRGVSIERR
jgi:hypothetical protein